METLKSISSDRFNRGACETCEAAFGWTRINQTYRQTMSRLPFNALVLPFRIRAGRFECAVLHRSDADWWQFIAGGGEGQENPMAAARLQLSSAHGRLEWLAYETALRRLTFDSNKTALWELHERLGRLPETAMLTDAGTDPAR